MTISDNGKGISLDFLPYAFDYFRQADSTSTRSFGGLGLGLAIVRYLVELHGGTVRAESAGEGQGAKFIVRLPVISVAKSHQTHVSSNTSSGFNLNGLQVLFVDDERDSRELVTFLLEQHGAAVTPVESAHEALANLYKKEFDLLISDIGMPMTDGYALIRQIKEQLSDKGREIMAIALTAYAGEMDQQQALAAGFQQHITKPIEPELLIQTIWTLVQSKGNLK
jgi:CheY-like chemotaxis protein